VRLRVHVLAVVLVCVLMVLGETLPAYAYIDPNAAGLLSQVLIPLLVAGAAVFTFFRKQVAALFLDLSRCLRRRADV